MHPFNPILPLGLIVALVWWDIHKRSDPRSIYCLGLISGCLAWIVIWISSICSLPDPILIFELVWFRGSLAIAFASRFWEEVSGKVRAGGRGGVNAVYHLLFACAAGYYMFQLPLALTDGAHTTKICTNTRKYFSGFEVSSDIVTDTGQDGEDKAEPMPKSAEAKATHSHGKHGPSHHSNRYAQSP